MRVAVLGDIHGNPIALETVLKAVRRNGIDTVFITGDYVGYYRGARGVLRLLSAWPENRMYRVRGNHEDMLQRIIDNPAYRAECTQRYGGALAAAAAELDAAQLSDLMALPARLSIDLCDRQIMLGHGAPWNTDEYLYPDAPESAWERVAAEGADFVFLGHTHYPLIRRSGHTTIVNPGSVGQPRDGRPGAAWAAVDLMDGAATLFAEAYDWTPVAEEARRLDPGVPYLHEIFSRT